jgi:hypothetical protein
LLLVSGDGVGSRLGPSGSALCVKAARRRCRSDAC